MNLPGDQKQGGFLCGPSQVRHNVIGPIVEPSRRVIEPNELLLHHQDHDSVDHSLLQQFPLHLAKSRASIVNILDHEVCLATNNSEDHYRTGSPMFTTPVLLTYTQHTPTNCGSNIQEFAILQSSFTTDVPPLLGIPETYNRN
jgi:hypothetical protein